MFHAVTELRAAFRRALRLCLLRRVPQAAAGPRLGAVFALFLLVLFLNAALNVISSHSLPSFNEYGIMSHLAGMAVFSAAIAVLGQSAGRAQLRRALADFMVIYVFYMSAMVFLLMALVLLGDSNDYSSGSYVTFRYAVWGMAYGTMLAACWRAGTKLWPRPLRLSGARFVAAVLLPVFLIPNQPIFYSSTSGFGTLDVWYWSRRAIAALQPADAFDDGYSESAYSDVEGALYQQSAMLERMLGALKPASSSDPQYFFLGAAPSAAQDVFRKEVLGAQALFDENFGTRGHSAVLINSTDTIESVPLASGTNLEVALAGIGNVMNRDRDVLVLFITSHGAKGIVSVDFPDFPFNQITPESLSKALAKSRIKNRVMIISACHAGSFIPELAGPDTLIMAAAHADKTSFGCSNERDGTYFGDALFNHALKTETSFEKAFAAAKALIETWEKEQDLKPSEPQISVGAAIRDVLGKMPLTRTAASRSSD